MKTGQKRPHERIRGEPAVAQEGGELDLEQIDRLMARGALRSFREERFQRTGVEHGASEYEKEGLQVRRTGTLRVDGEAPEVRAGASVHRAEHLCKRPDGGIAGAIGQDELPACVRGEPSAFSCRFESDSIRAEVIAVVKPADGLLRETAKLLLLSRKQWRVGREDDVVADFAQSAQIEQVPFRDPAVGGEGRIDGGAFMVARRLAESDFQFSGACGKGGFDRSRVKRRGRASDEASVLLVVDKGAETARPHLGIELHIGVAGEFGRRPASVWSRVEEVVELRRNVGEGKLRMVADVPVAVEQRRASDRVEVDRKPEQANKSPAIAKRSERQSREKTRPVEREGGVSDRGSEDGPRSEEREQMVVRMDHGGGIMGRSGAIPAMTSSLP